jgi:hypothetical protein
MAVPPVYLFRHQYELPRRVIELGRVMPDVLLAVARCLMQLEHFAALEDIGEKRSAWWWWLAQRVLDRIDELTIVRRADVLVGRDEVTRSLPAKADARDTPEAVAGAAQNESVLDERERQAIRAICMQAAASLGVAD